MSPADLRDTLTRMVLAWGTATTWRVYWRRMIPDMAGPGTPVWHEHVGRA